MNNLYKINIYEKYKELKNNNIEIDNFKLSKIFEWFTCIKLSEEHNNDFYEYNDITPKFKEINKLSPNDTGIDCCNLIDTIVQCKLRKNTLTWNDCSTFFGSQNILKDNKKIIRWDNLIISRNEECKLSNNLLFRNDLFIDKTYKTEEIINYCNDLFNNPPEYPKEEIQEFKLRDYQLECIDLIKNKQNNIICLPTGTGKNIIIVNSLLENKKYLILVPRIVLLEQIKDEIIKHKPLLKKKIQLIGDNNVIKENKDIFICVYNSIDLIEDFNIFDKIFVDEAHHIYKPEIYEDIEYVNNNEEIEEETYIDKIQDLTKYNNNVYLSATIDELEGFNYYIKNIKEMIELKYLCDYDIKIPIFSEENKNIDICNYLLNNYNHIIIYCNSCKEGQFINEKLNNLQNNSSKYIDCNTPKTERKEILKNYKEGKIPFLVNVRILIEGFDAPITNGVCFIHLPSTNTTAIQIIGRALRLHKLKKLAHIILPFSVDDNEKEINNFIRILMKNDSRINKYTVNVINNIGNTDIIIDETKFNCLHEKIYSSIEVPLDKNELWNLKLNQVQEYIILNNKRPLSKEFLGSFLCCQLKYYRKNKLNKICFDKMTEFLELNKQYFLSNEEYWNDNLIKVQNFINNNNKTPSIHDKNKDIKILGSWLDTQKQNYKNKEQIIKNDDIYNKMTEFLELNKQYFLSNEEYWNDNLIKVQNYINDNNKTPSSVDKNKDIKILGSWLSTQKQNYKNKEQIMKNDDIYNKMTEFLELNKQYLLSNEEYWNDNLIKVQNFINNNNKTPSTIDKNKDIKILGKWLSTQKNNYKNKKYIMKNNDIYNKMTEFLELNKHFFN